MPSPQRANGTIEPACQSWRCLDFGPGFPPPALGPEVVLRLLRLLRLPTTPHASSAGWLARDGAWAARSARRPAGVLRCASLSPLVSWLWQSDGEWSGPEGLLVMGSGWDS